MKFILAVTCSCGWSKAGTPESFHLGRRNFGFDNEVYIICEECGKEILYRCPHNTDYPVQNILDNKPYVIRFLCTFTNPSDDRESSTIYHYGDLYKASRFQFLYETLKEAISALPKCRKKMYQRSRSNCVIRVTEVVDLRTNKVVFAEDKHTVELQEARERVARLEREQNELRR